MLKAEKTISFSVTHSCFPVSVHQYTYNSMYFRSYMHGCTRTIDPARFQLCPGKKIWKLFAQLRETNWKELPWVQVQNNSPLTIPLKCFIVVHCLREVCVFVCGGFRWTILIRIVSSQLKNFPVYTVNNVTSVITRNPVYHF